MRARHKVAHTPQPYPAFALRFPTTTAKPTEKDDEREDKEDYPEKRPFTVVFLVETAKVQHTLPDREERIDDIPKDKPKGLPIIQSCRLIPETWDVLGFGNEWSWGQAGCMACGERLSDGEGDGWMVHELGDGRNGHLVSIVNSLS